MKTETKQVSVPVKVYYCEHCNYHNTSQAKVRNHEEAHFKANLLKEVKILAFQPEKPKQVPFGFTIAHFPTKEHQAAYLKENYKNYSFSYFYDANNNPQPTWFILTESYGAHLNISPATKENLEAAALFLEDRAKAFRTAAKLLEE